MINIKDIRNQKINTINLVKALFYSFPLTFILGNLAVTLNLLLFIIMSFFIIKKKKLNLRFSASIWLLIIFFSYLFISTTIQFGLPGLLNEGSQYWSFEENPIFKSIMLLRFPILILVVDTLFFNKILNLKKFLLSSFVCTTFVSFDVIFQYFIGFDLFGYKSLGDRNPGPFGEEWISGSYLQKFSLFSIFFVNEISKNKNFRSSIVVFVIVFHFLAIFLAGNRMPMLLFFLGIVLIILFIKNLRIIFVSSVFIFSLITSLVINNDKSLKHTYSHFFDQINILKLLNFSEKKVKLENKQDLRLALDDKDLYNNPADIKTKLLYTTGHSSIYRTAMIMWKEQPLFGFGLKSFRIKCRDVDEKAERIFTVNQMPYYNIGFACSNHAHNYYIELLAETGIVGISLIIVFFIICIKDSFYYLKKYYREKNSDMLLFIPAIIVLLIEIWPLKSSGSFFSTWSSTFFWLNISLLILINQKKE